MLLQPDRVGEGVHRERVLGGPLGPEERDLRAEPEHEEVVGQGRHVRESHLACLEVDRGHRRLVDGDVVLVAVVDEVAERVTDGARLEEARRELVQERLEGVIVVPIDEDDVGVGLAQLERRAKPAEPSAEDEHARTVVARAHRAPSVSCACTTRSCRPGLRGAPFTTMHESAFRPIPPVTPTGFHIGRVSGSGITRVNGPARDDGTVTSALDSAH